MTEDQERRASESSTYDPDHDRSARVHRDEYESDSNNNGYDPDAGSTTPTDGRCNALLTNWRERYGEKRYCQQLPQRVFGEEYDSDRCQTHAGRDTLYMRAREAMETGLFTKTVFHFFDKLSPEKRLLAYGLYDRLIEESIYDFDTELITVEIDFSTAETTGLVGPHLDDDGVLALQVPAVSKHNDRGIALLLAALDRIKMVNAQAKIMGDGLEREQVADSELVFNEGEAPRWEQLTEMTEHHLNLPYSRLVRDSSDLLQYGGIGVDEADDDAEKPAARLEIFDDPAAQDAIDPETLQGDMSDIPVQDL